MVGMRKCPECGAYSSDDMAVCGKCGRSIADTPKVAETSEERLKRIWADQAVADVPASGGTPASDSAQDSLLSIAYNVRRMFILGLYIVIVIVLGQVLALWVEVFAPGESTTWAAFTVFLIVVVLLGAWLIYRAIYDKRLTRGSSSLLRHDNW